MAIPSEISPLTVKPDIRTKCEGGGKVVAFRQEQPSFSVIVDPVPRAAAIGPHGAPTRRRAEAIERASGRRAAAI